MEGEIWITIESHPRRDRKIKNMLEEYFDDVKFAGGIGKTGDRVITIKDKTASVEEVSDILYQYVKSGVVKYVDETPEF